MRFLTKAVCTTLCISTLSTPLYARSAFDITEDAKAAIENPEQFISHEEVEMLKIQDDDNQFIEAAKNLVVDTHKRIDEEIQRLSFDEQEWVIKRDKNALIEEGQGLSQNMEPQSALGSPGEVRYVVYLSLGMPEQEFNQAMTVVKAREDTFGVIRGLVEKDHSIPDTMRFLYNRWNEGNPDGGDTPLIYLDPMLFSDYAVESVPTVIRFDGKKPTLRAKGILNVDWVEDQFESGRNGDIGQQGPIYEIAEEDFMKTVERRMERLDEEKMTQEAIGRFWGNQKFNRLATAEKTESFIVDLTFTVQKDIQLPSGEYLAKKGSKINPLHMMPFQRIGIVFDGSSKAQAEWAKKEVERAKRKNTIPIVMITDLDLTGDGWKAFEELNESIPGVAVKLANSPILNRFQVEKVPSRFEQDGMMIRVTEFGKEDY